MNKQCQWRKNSVRIVKYEQATTLFCKRMFPAIKFWVGKILSSDLSELVSNLFHWTGLEVLGFFVLGQLVLSVASVDVVLKSWNFEFEFCHSSTINKELFAFCFCLGSGGYLRVLCIVSLWLSLSSLLLILMPLWEK